MVLSVIDTVIMSLYTKESQISMPIFSKILNPEKKLTAAGVPTAVLCYRILVRSVISRAGMTQMS